MHISHSGVPGRGEAEGRACGRGALESESGAGTMEGMSGLGACIRTEAQPGRNPSSEGEPDILERTGTLLMRGHGFSLGRHTLAPALPLPQPRHNSSDYQQQKVHVLFKNKMYNTHAVHVSATWTFRFRQLGSIRAPVVVSPPNWATWWLLFVLWSGPPCRNRPLGVGSRGQKPLPSQASRRRPNKRRQQTAPTNALQTNTDGKLAVYEPLEQLQKRRHPHSPYHGSPCITSSASARATTTRELPAEHHTSPAVSFLTHFGPVNNGG
jgi:hypothetical protein